MKTKLLLFLFLGIFSLNAQVRITLVNPNTDAITIHNFGGSTVDITNYWLCTQITYQQLNSITPQSGSYILASGADVTLITTSISLDDTAADLGLYTTNSFNSSTAMIDFLQWGGSFDFPNGRENVAVSKGIWGDEEFITEMSPYEYTGNGTTENGIAFWGTVLSINNFSRDIKFSISPNPVSTLLKLQPSEKINTLSLSVYNLLGERIINKKFSFDNIIEVDVSSLNQGLYLLKMNNQTKRFIKL